jgi:hypothetical protein
VTARKTTKTRQAEGTLVLTSDEAALIRRALADCCDVIDRAGSAGPVVLAALQAAALDAPDVRRPLDQVQGAASLATGHIDFPRLGRSS